MFETSTFSTISVALAIVISPKYFDVATFTIGHYFTHLKYLLQPCTLKYAARIECPHALFSN
jgi:hypothetical protein